MSLSLLQKSSLPLMNNKRFVSKASVSLLFFFLSLTARADWWTQSARGELDAAGSHFKVSFNISNGVLHTQTYVYNGAYLQFGCCIFKSVWVQSATMAYSLDGINFIDFYSFGFDHGTQIANNVAAGYSLNTYPSSSSKGDQLLNMDLVLTNQIKNIKKIRISARLAADDPVFWGGPIDIVDTKDISIPQMSGINTPTYEFVTVQNNGVFEPRAKVSYTKLLLNEVDNVSKMVLNDNALPRNNRLYDNMPVALSGSNNVPVSNTPIGYYYQQLAYNERWYLSSALVTIPAFVFPKTASAVYDPVNQQVKFSWTMDPVSSSNVVTDRFKLQIADNANFTDARDVNVDYDQTQSTFTYIVDKDFAPQMYFRVARAHPGFNWELAKTASVAVIFSPIPATANAKLLIGKTAQLTWDPLPSAWLPGSTFIITRINNTSKTQSEIRLNKQDFDAGTYTDKQISTCNSYNYTLQVVPPLISSFTAFAPLQIPEEILPTEIGSLISLDVSKGYFPDRTELRWSTSGGFDNFLIKRAIYGTNNYVQVATVPGSINSEYQTDDAKGTPGVYYNYQVIGVVKCNNTSVFSNETLMGIGFRSPTGNIYGRITYENGQAVEDVAVRLQSNDAVQLGKSIYLNGTPGSYLQLDKTTAPFSDSAFTIEMWIKPDDAQPVNQALFFRGNQYLLGFDDNGELYFSFMGGTPASIIRGAYSNPNHTFVHVTGIHTKDSLFLLLNDQIIARGEAPYAASDPGTMVYFGTDTGVQLFKGFLDEVRIYDIALTYEEAVKAQTRLVTGDETGLAAYWRFDETIADQFYDLSFHGEIYNRNDGTMSTAAVTRSTTIPSVDQLSLKSFTDLSGNYFIAGIPYIGNGTTYTIVPLKGTHQFDPVSVNRLISPSSTQFTVDFKDKSSFIVSGHVYYKNTTVPVPGVQFKIDGQFAQQSNGEILQTDDNGMFTISAPVGTHEVKAVKTNHVFANDGKITDLNGNNLNYQNHVSGVNLTDSTTIRFIGRVAGGAIQQDLPLGHSVSFNNLGKESGITLLLPTGNKYELNDAPDSKTDTVLHLLPGNISDSASIHKTTVTYNRNNIVIKPDPVTGEFIADLIPVKFIAQSVDVTGWGDLLEGKPVLLDFINKFSVQSSVHRFTDSSLNNLGVYVKTNYYDSLTFNDSYKFIKRVTPAVEIAQKSGDGKTLPYFGNIKYESIPITGVKETIIVADTTKTGMAIYNFGNPVFVQNQAFTFGISAYEQYPFYESVINGVPVIKQENGKAVVNNVPTSDGFVSILNTIRNGSTAPDTLRLNEKGTADYLFTVGDPNLATQGIKSLSASIRFGEATNINWKWNGNPQLQVYVMGGKLTGTDFVTAGPDHILMVLRDPPGSKSFSFAESGSTISKKTTYSGSFDNVGDVEITQQLGTELVTFTGLGVGTINTVKAVTGETIGFSHEEHYTSTSSKETSTTLTTRFQSSDDPLFVGPIADVFVGYSSNITYGASRNITIIPRADLKASDLLLYEPAPASTYIVVQRNGINIGETFGTMFAYPQQHIEKILIPNLAFIRNTALWPVGSSLTAAQDSANSTKKAIYISKLGNTDSLFGRSNNDTVAFGQAAKTAPFGDGPSYKIVFPNPSVYRSDTIMILNQYIAAWEKRMAENEKAKIEAELVQNYSYHAGSPVQYTKSTSIQQNNTEEYKFIISGGYTNSSDIKINGIGLELKVVAKTGTEQGNATETGSSTSTTVGFNLASEGTDDYFSIDLKNAADNSLVFNTKGGVSGCPYAGATISKYYQPGTVIDQPTQRVEVPVLLVDKPVANDVPTSRKAVYNLTLRNESEAKLPATFIIGYTDNDSVKGATLAIDGAPIGGTGRVVYLQYGESITKVLTLTKGPDALDYNNIQVLLHSNCQYDPTGYRENIADTVLISAHFIPSCSDIDIKSPKDKWVLNSESPVNAEKKRYLPITIDKFDVKNSLFDHIELQYKPTSSSTWITAIAFYADSTKFNAAQGEKQFITNPSAIDYNLVMDDAAFNDQLYDVQAVSYCSLGSGNYVTTESNLISGIKDTYNPRLFGSPQPANGVLTAKDDVRLNFNETIASGLLTASNFQVTGIRNGAESNHSVSVRLDGIGNYLSTEFEKSFTGKNITAEMWVLPSAAATHTLFSHGDVNQSLELALTSDNKMQVTIGNNVIKSTNAFNFKAGEWAHIALVYNDNSKTVSAYYNFIPMISNAPVSAYTGTGHIEYGRSIRQMNNYYNGKIHEARIWNDTLNSLKLQINSLKVLSGSENALLAYYPMNEGKGSVAFDKAHGSNAKLNGLWSTPAGKAVNLNGTGYVKINTAAAPITSDMDYTIELWFKGDASQADGILVSNGKGDGTDPDGSLNLFQLGFESGLLTFRNNGFKVQADGQYLDNKWHNVAIAVNRNSGSAQLTMDGQLNQFFDAKNLGGIASAYISLGARTYYTADDPVTPKYDRYFKGNMDEFRLWNTYLNQTLIANNNNVRLQGNELGLLAYYPFETYTMFQGVTQLYYSLKDAKQQEVPSVVIPDATVLNGTESDETAPIKDSGPVENLRFDFVANNDALIINLQEPKQSIDKSIITFKAKNIRDLNGNLLLSPVTWTAYIDQNLVKWSDKEINLEKEVGEPLTFTSYLVNNGGNSQQYSIYNLPSWLTASPSTGSVDPNGNQKIEFIVNKGLNIGSYEEIIFMRNDNNETEALKLTLEVKGKKPNWAVNASEYDFNMVVYGKLRINNIFSINEEDMLGAFIKGKCVGVANNTFNASNNLWYTFLTIYSNELTTANIEFRIWQASTGKTFIATASKTVTFANNAVTGTPAFPVIFDGSNLLYQNIALNQNWNWISFNLVIPDNTPTGTTLQNGTWAVDDLIKNDAGKGFMNYTSNGSWSGTLKSLDNLSLYKMKVANAQTLPVSGTPVNVKTLAIPLKGAQWNYISYLPPFNSSLKESLAGYQASDEDVIKSQTGFAMYSAQNGWIGSLNYLEPGKGYMLFRKRSTDTAFYYPTITGSLVGGRLTGRTEMPNAQQLPVAGNFSHANNMTIIAVVAPGFDFKNGDSIIAYVNGEVRGKAKPILNPETKQHSYFFNVGGEAEQTLVFMLERDGNIIGQSSTFLRYVSNTIVGTLTRPLELKFEKNADVVTVSPNPFNQAITIRVDVSGTTGVANHEVQWSVFDVLGRKVWNAPAQRITGTMYSATWDGKNTAGSLSSNGVYFIQVLVNGIPHFYKVIKQ